MHQVTEQSFRRHIDRVTHKAGGPRYIISQAQNLVHSRLPFRGHHISSSSPAMSGSHVRQQHRRAKAAFPSFLPADSAFDHLVSRTQISGSASVIPTSGTWRLAARPVETSFCFRSSGQAAANTETEASRPSHGHDVRRLSRSRCQACFSPICTKSLWAGRAAATGVKRRFEHDKRRQWLAHRIVRRGTRTRRGPSPYPPGTSLDTSVVLPACFQTRGDIIHHATQIRRGAETASVCHTASPSRAWKVEAHARRCRNTKMLRQRSGGSFARTTRIGSGIISFQARSLFRPPTGLFMEQAHPYHSTER